VTDFSGHAFTALAVRVEKTLEGESLRSRADEMPAYGSVWSGRHQAFRPCVLFLENVPAETR
jgi:hypothetical protein